MATGSYHVEWRMHINKSDVRDYRHLSITLREKLFISVCWRVPIYIIQKLCMQIANINLFITSMMKVFWQSVWNKSKFLKSRYSDNENIMCYSIKKQHFNKCISHENHCLPLKTSSLEHPSKNTTNYKILFVRIM